MAAPVFKQFAEPFVETLPPRDPELMRRLTDHSNRRRSALEIDRQQYFDHWREISEWLDPRRGQWLWDYNKAQDRGRKKQGRIINSHAGLAAKIMANGMQSGVTPRSRPWFEAESLNPDANTDRDAQEWLLFVQNTLRSLLESSNFYATTRINYRELGTYGGGPISVVQDAVDVVRYRQHTIGSYYVGIDAKGRIDTFGEELVLTIDQMLDRYGYERLSQAAQRCADMGRYDAKVRVMRLIEPNRSPFYDPNGVGWQRMPYRTVDYDPADSSGATLSTSGLFRFNIAFPRWETVSDEAYPSNCPGMEALGDIKGLQAEEYNKAEAIEQIPRPTLVAPASLKGKADRPVPGETIYSQQMQGQQGIARAFELNPQIGEIRQDIREIEFRIDRHFHRDVFQAITMIDRAQTREIEIDARIREQMGQIGPIVEDLLQTQNDTLLQLTYEAADDMGIIPPAPPVIAEAPLRMNYVSILAQGQNASDLDRLDRFHGAVLRVSETHPEARHRFDADKWIQEYGSSVGVPVDVISDDREVQAARTAEMEANAAANAAATAKDATAAMQQLGNTDISDESAVRALSEVA